MTHVTCRLTAKNRDQLRNPTLGNRVWAVFAFYTLFLHHAWLQGSVIWADDMAHRLVPVLMTLNDREGRRKPVAGRFKCSPSNVLQLILRVARSLYDSWASYQRMLCIHCGRCLYIIVGAARILWGAGSM